MNQSWIIKYKDYAGNFKQIIVSGVSLYYAMQGFCDVHNELVISVDLVFQDN